MKNRKNDPLNVLGIIPARGGSKGIPKKNLIKINEKPLLYYTINASLSSRFVTKTIVTSDDATILKKTKELGAIGIKRPQKLANSSSQIESSIEYTLEYLKKHEKYELIKKKNFLNNYQIFSRLFLSFKYFLYFSR